MVDDARRLRLLGSPQVSDAPPLWKAELDTRAGERLALEAAGTLFTVPFSSTSNERSYDVTADGQRVVAVRVPDTAAPRRIDIVTHWLDELARQVPR